MTKKEIRDRYYLKHREEINARTREYRKRTNNVDTHKYEKTPKGFLMRLYRNMESRVTGVQKLKAHLYKGKELLERESFYEWALSHPKFWEMFRFWESNHYNRKLTPTVNRIDSTKGYALENIEWLTHSDNSRLTSNYYARRQSPTLPVMEDNK